MHIKMFKLKGIDICFLILFIFNVIPSSLAGFIVPIKYSFVFICTVIAIVNKYKPSRFVKLLIVYLLYWSLISYIRGTETANIIQLFRYLRLVLCVVSIEFYIKTVGRKAVSLLYRVMLLLGLTDCITVFLFPDGLFFVRGEWGEIGAYWLFGPKNTHLVMQLIMLVLMVIDNYIFFDGKFTFWNWSVIIIVVASEIVLKSSAASSAIVFASVGFVLYQLPRVKTNRHYNLLMLMIVYIIFQVLLVTGNVLFANSFVQNIFGKTLEFSGRSYIWASALLSIPKHLVLGHGSLSAQEAVNLVGNINAHNQWIDVLVKGGICGLFIFCLIWREIIKKIGLLSDYKIYNMLLFLILTLFLDMLFEIIGEEAWILLCILFCTYDTLSANLNRCEKRYGGVSIESYLHDIPGTEP